MSDELIKLPVTFNETSVGPMFSDADGLNLAAFSAIGDEKAIGEYIATCISEHESLKAQLAEAKVKLAVIEPAWDKIAYQTDLLAVRNIMATAVTELDAARAFLDTLPEQERQA